MTHEPPAAEPVPSLPRPGGDASPRGTHPSCTGGRDGARAGVAGVLLVLLGAGLVVGAWVGFGVGEGGRGVVGEGHVDAAAVGCAWNGTLVEHRGGPPVGSWVAVVNGSVLEARGPDPWREGDDLWVNATEGTLRVRGEGGTARLLLDTC